MKKLLSLVLIAALFLLPVGCNSTNAYKTTKTVVNAPDRIHIRVSRFDNLTVTSSHPEGGLIEVYDTRAIPQLPDNSGVWVSGINAVSRVAGYVGLGWVVNSLGGGGDVFNQAPAE